MEIYTLESYLRGQLSSKWTYYVKKDKCERCGCKNNLELHHDTSFVELLQETLNDLNLPYHKDKSLYSEDEIKLIKQLFIGKHYDYMIGLTLCEKCHDKYHSEFGQYRIIKNSSKDRFLQKVKIKRLVGKSYKKNTSNKKLLKFLSKNEGKYITKDSEEYER